MNEEEILKILTDEDMYWNYLEKQVLEATGELLNLCNQEKEKNKKLEDEAILLRKTHNYDVKMIDDVKGEYNKLFKELQQEKEKNKKLEKVIDMLIEDIVEYHIPADFCMQYGKYKENCKTLDDNQMCKKCIRDYYFKEARGESNE